MSVEVQLKLYLENYKAKHHTHYQLQEELSIPGKSNITIILDGTK